MNVEWPLLERCCICFPLRHGLIVWGYIRLIMSAIAVSGFMFWSYMFLMAGLAFHAEIDPAFWLFMSMLLFFVLLGITDIVLNIYVVIGGQTKNVKYLESYYTYSFILCVLTTVILGFLTYISWEANEGNPEVIKGVILLIAQIVVQVYVLLLVNSEIVKLKNSCHIQFINNASETECTMYNSEVPNVPESNQCIKVPETV